MRIALTLPTPLPGNDPDLPALLEAIAGTEALGLDGVWMPTSRAAFSAAGATDFLAAVFTPPGEDAERTLKLLAASR